MDQSPADLVVVQDHNRRHSFVPAGTLESDKFAKDSYWETLVESVLQGSDFSSPPRDYVAAIRSGFLRVFCILVDIGYGRYFDWFLQSGLDDLQLPFEERPSSFPTGGDAQALWEKFEAAQWMFCAPPLRFFYRNRSFHSKLILPLVEVTHLGDGATASVYMVQVHPAHDMIVSDAGAVPRSSETHTYTLKRFNESDREEHYQKELKAYQILRAPGDPPPQLIQFFGGIKQSERSGIFLEYADAGNLEQFFQDHAPPRSQREMINFFEALWELLNAVAHIHTVGPAVSARGAGAALQPLGGIHQDIKPSNILVLYSGNGCEYPYMFKLADLAESAFVPTAAFGCRHMAGYATKTYGAPESHRINGTERFAVPQSVDIFSLGCVFNVAAVWATSGKAGLDEYRLQREEGTKHTTAEEFKDCFHDGVEVLEVVSDRNRQLARENGIVAALAPLMDQMLGAAANRPSAQNLWKSFLRAKNQLGHSHISPLRSSHSPVGDVGFGIPPLPRSADRSAWGGNEWLMRNGSDHTSRKGSSAVFYPPAEATESFHNQHAASAHTLQPTTATQGSPTMKSHPHYSPDTIATGMAYEAPNEESSIQRDQDFSTISSIQQSFSFNLGTAQQRRRSSQAHLYHHTQQRRNKRAQSMDFPQGSSFPSIRARRDASATPILKRLETSSLALPHKSQQSPYSIVEQRASTVSPQALNLNSTTSTLPLNGPSRNTSEEDDFNQAVDALHAHPKATMRVAREIVPRTTSSTPRPPLEYWKYDQLHQWITDKKQGRNKYNFPQHLVDRLKHNELIFIFDNSQSMSPSWKQVAKHARALTYAIKDQDDNGLDALCMHGSDPQRINNSSSMLNFVRNISPVGQSDFPTKLEEVLEKYISACRQRAEGGSTRGFLPFLDRQQILDKRTRFYVFTDGVWQSKSDAKPIIRRTVQALEQAQLSSGHITIQFIQFGEDPEGSQRLDELDRLHQIEGLARDIVDNEHASGNVWKMLLGATDRTWDGDDMEGDG